MARRRPSPPASRRAPAAPEVPGPSLPGPGAGRPARAWSWRVRLFACVAAPMVLLGAVEGILRVAGVGWPTGFFLPTPAGEGWFSNPRFAWTYMAAETATQPVPGVLTRPKAAGTRRVFVLGESAAAGTPEPAFGMARQLGHLLEHAYPGQRIEVVNAALRGVNSHALVAMARDCARFEPDVYVVYAGNNERVGLYAPEPTGWNAAAWPRVLRLRQAVLRTRLGQVMAGLLRKPSTAAAPDMAGFRSKRLHPSDPRRAAVDANFARNLDDICRIAHRAGARAVLSTVAVNLRDFPPLGSLPRPGLPEADRLRFEAALEAGEAAMRRGPPGEGAEHFREAVGADDQSAHAWYRLGQAEAALGRMAEAREAFLRARDCDALPFRTDRALNAIVRSVADRHAGRGVRLVDTEGAFAGDAEAAKEGGIPGARQFRDHVHFTFAGDYLAARTLFPAVSDALGLGAPAGPVATVQECANALAYTEWDALGLEAAIQRMLARPPFLDQLDHAERQRGAEESVRRRTDAFQRGGGPGRVLSAYEAAVKARPDDWPIRALFATALEDFGQPAAALAQQEAAVRLMPWSARLRVELAQALDRQGRRAEALAQIDAALRIDPANRGALEGRRALGGDGRR